MTEVASHHREDLSIDQQLALRTAATRLTIPNFLPLLVRAAAAVVTMGCGDAYPIFPGKRYENWDLDDPAVPMVSGR
jgi:hypothetical protein